MITAEEALKLYEESGAVLQKQLDCYENYIKSAAKSGERFVEIYVDCQPEHNSIELTDHQKRVCEELKKLGFLASFRFYGDSYIPRAYDENENDTNYRDFGYVIGW